MTAKGPRPHYKNPQMQPTSEKLKSSKETATLIEHFSLGHDNKDMSQFSPLSLRVPTRVTLSSKSREICKENWLKMLRSSLESINRNRI